MKFKKFLALFAVATILTLTGCAQSNSSSNSANEQSSQSSSQTTQSSSISSSSSQSSTTSSSTTTTEEMRPEVEEILKHLESLKLSANEKYTELEQKYGSISKFPAADRAEWYNRQAKYYSYLKGVDSLKLNSAEKAYYKEIDKIKFLG